MLFAPELAQQQSNAWQYPLGDILGSVRQWTDASGAATYAVGYTPFGEELWHTGSATSAWGYTGEWQDPSVGMVYLRARWYEPGVGRFTRRDPVRLEANLYLYASGDPINRIDPLGLLSNATIAASMNVESFEDVLALFEENQNWAFLKMLQDANLGDRVYGGLFSWASLEGTIKCQIHSHWVEEGGVLLLAPEVGIRTLSRLLMEMAEYPPASIWYYLNNDDTLPAYTNKTSSGILADYVTGNLGYSLGFTLGIGGNFQGVIDRFGNVYVGLSGDIGVGVPGVPSGGIAMGWLAQNRLVGDSWIPTSAELGDFIEGWGGGVAGSLGFGGGIAYNYSDDFPRKMFSQTIAGEYGVILPTFEWNFAGYMWWITQKSWLEWDWVDRYPIQHGYGRESIRMVDDSSMDCGCQDAF